MSRLFRPSLFLGFCGGNAWNKTATCSLHNRHFSNESKWNNFGTSDLRFREDQVPKQSDILIVGGGLIGWSVAFWMRWTTKFGVTVVERDPTYARSASVLGLGSIRQQFSEPENIQMSLFGSDFLRNIKDYLSVLDDSQLDIEFNPQGCLLLADGEQAGTMEQNFHLQTELGAKVELLSNGALKSRWPWLNVEDIELGCYVREDQVPKQSDILIVGGGLIGWSVAFWMRWTTKFGVTVVERDPTYARSASVLGLGSIRQQFSEPENIQMSLFGSDFLRNIKDYLSVLDDSQLDIEFNPQGCLLLADGEQAGTMEQNFHLQTELGAKVELLSNGALKSRWPWLNVEDIELGCYGYENEGWFDPWLLLKALRAKCHMLGVNYVVGEVVDFEASQYLTEISFPDMPKRAPVIGRALREAVIALPDGSTSNITFNMVVNAAGPWAADLTRLAEIGTTEQLAIPLPVEPRLRHVYVVRPKRAVLSSQGRRPPEPTVEPEPLQSPGLDTPFIVDPKRLFVERRGLSGEFIVYSDDPQWDSVLVTAPQQSCNFNADYTLFKESLGQQLAHRIPTLASVDVSPIVPVGTRFPSVT
ncbi:FAD-dependent oxidoreductase domain-containing protein 1 [Paragonimus westermani]|uniref:FAD-dependent oxidoreductase domain-containing protein 1 n=1 Tax=Paragonimus westermani TaxID=34504 RepID=A0A5J4NB75_9TREM|nr:FAD-dependent oxidoreductase domain-containing protein 1 [Paragonimus westermani]